MDSKKKKIIIASVVAVAIVIASVTTGVVVSKKNKDKATSFTEITSATNAEGWSENETTTEGKEVTTQATSDSASAQKTPGANASKPSNTGSNARPNGSSSNHGTNGRPGGSSSSGSKPSGGSSSSGNSGSSSNKPAPKPTQPQTTKPQPKPTKPASKTLTASQKQWVIDNYFKKFPQHGAASGFQLIEQNDNNGLSSGMVLTQDDYKEQIAIADYKKDYDGTGSLIDFEAEGCEAVYYHFYEKDGKTILKYSCAR